MYTYIHTYTISIYKGYILSTSIKTLYYKSPCSAWLHDLNKRILRLQVKKSANTAIYSHAHVHTVHNTGKYIGLHSHAYAHRSTLRTHSHTYTCIGLPIHNRRISNHTYTHGTPTHIHNRTYIPAYTNTSVVEITLDLPDPGYQQ